MQARPCISSQATILKNTRYLSLSSSTTGLHIGFDRTVSPTERHKRLAAYVSAWRGLEWRRVSRVPFPPADAAQIHAVRLASPLRGVPRKNFIRHLPVEVRAWALDPAQDLLLFIEQDEDGPPYPVHSISMKTGRRHSRAARLPSLDEEQDPWLDSSEDVVRIHGLLAGVVHAGRLRVYEWRTGNLLLNVSCSDDFLFLDNSHVLTTNYDPDTLLPSIMLYPLLRDRPRNAPAYCFNLPRLRSTLDGAEVFVRLAADSPPSTSRFGAFHADSSPNHRALVVQLEVFTLSDPNNGHDHASTLCMPLGFFKSVLEGAWNHSTNAPEKDAHGTSVVQWHHWGPSACGLIPQAAGGPSQPGVFGCRAARVISGSNLHKLIPAAQTTSSNDDNAVEEELDRLTLDSGDIFFELFDFHPGRVALARAALEKSRLTLSRARKDEVASGADVRAEDELSATNLDVGVWSIQQSGDLDTRIWDVSPYNAQSIETGVGAATRLRLPFILTRRRIPAQYVLGQSGGKAILTEDAVLYVPVRDFVTGEPDEYVAFVF